MSSKSNCFVVDVSPENCSTTHGIIKVLKKVQKFVPSNEDGTKRRKVVVLGDQAYIEQCNVAIASRTKEAEPSERLNCFLPQGQDWHACKVQPFVFTPFSPFEPLHHTQHRFTISHALHYSFTILFRSSS